MSDTITIVKAPISTCYRHPLLLERIGAVEEAVIDKLRNGLSSGIAPVGSYTDDGRIIVFKHYYLLSVLSCLSEDKVSVNIVPNSVEYHLREMADHAWETLYPLELLSFLTKIKKDLKCSDTNLARIIGRKRVTVSRVMSLHRLCSEAYKLLSERRMILSVAKDLSSLPGQLQEKALSILGKDCDNYPASNKVIRKLKGLATKTQAPDEIPEKAVKKSLEIIRFENDISLSLGQPTTLLSSKKNELKVQCFSVSELRGFVERLRESSVNITVSIHFDDYDHLDAILPDCDS
jgi:hypothetical protein